MEAILACYPARSTEWLEYNPKSCELWQNKKKLTYSHRPRCQPPLWLIFGVQSLIPMASLAFLGTTFLQTPEYWQRKSVSWFLHSWRPCEDWSGAPPTACLFSFSEFLQSALERVPWSVVVFHQCTRSSKLYRSTSAQQTSGRLQCISFNQARHSALPLPLTLYFIIGSAEALPILCVRCARWEREMQREWDGSDVTLVALKLAKKFALFLAKTLKLAIQAIEFSAEPSFFSSKKWIKLIPKTIGNRKKRLCVRLRSGDKQHLKKSSDRKAQIRRRSFRSPDWFVLFDLKIFSGGVYPPSATSRTISFFYFQ